MDMLFDHAPGQDDLDQSEGWLRWKIRKEMIEDES